MIIKPDLYDNTLSDIAKERIKKHYEEERKMVPLVIDKKVTIMVTPDKCNDEYRLAYIRKMNQGLGNVPVRRSIDIDMDKVREMIANGFSNNRIGKLFGVSAATIVNRLKKAEMGGGL